MFMSNFMPVIGGIGLLICFYVDFGTKVDLTNHIFVMFVNLGLGANYVL